MEISFDTTYTRLPPDLYARVDPTPVRAPRLVSLNHRLAATLGIDPARLASPAGVQALAGNRILSGSAPIALAYAGHQFGHFVPRLGDGRAILLGEIVGTDGARRDIQLKGSGRTPYSRGGDGRAALGPVLREYLISEAMAALGIPTTRALAAIATGEEVRRETDLPGAVLTRVAASHLRIGTFQFAARQPDPAVLRQLADYAIARHYPDAAKAENRALALLDGVVSRQADLVARWLLVGFIHGVMNTDNSSISGETIDYGPCAFMDAYDPATVFSSIDHHGRYAYGNQPQIMAWNLARLAETLLPLISRNEEQAVAEATAVLERFAPRFQAAYRAGLLRKIGIAQERDGDGELGQDFLTRMGELRADFTATFRALCDAAADPDITILEDPSWSARWRRRLAQDDTPPERRRAAMRAINPAVIPRNHHVEAALAAAVAHDDVAPFEELLDVLSTPFEDRPGTAHYADPPPPDQRVYQTFCGT